MENEKKIDDFETNSLDDFKRSGILINLNDQFIWFLKKWKKKKWKWLLIDYNCIK